MAIEGVGLNPKAHIHLTDHLAPLCTILDIPLLLTDSNDADKIKKYYPGLKTLVWEWSAFKLPFLFDQFNFFIQSEYWHREKFYSAVQSFAPKGKKIRNLHCPHGFSDKIFWFKEAVWEDMTLYYGERMLEIWKEEGVDRDLHQAIRCGNYRRLYYEKHKRYLDELCEKEVWSYFNKKQPLILYAPTCIDQEGATSFLEAAILLDRLPSAYNMLVKLHPSLEEKANAEVYRLIGKYQNKSNVLFLKDFPLIYPLLAGCNIYIGDMSSIGYDLLSFECPMFFLNQLKRDVSKDKRCMLYRCGTVIQPEEYSRFYSMMETSLQFMEVHKNSLKAIKTALYQKAFGDPIFFDQLTLTIKNAF